MMVSSKDLEREIRRYSYYLRRHDPQKGYLSTAQWVRYLERKIGGLSQSTLRVAVQRIKKRGRERKEIEEKLIQVSRERKGTTYRRQEIGWRFKPRRKKKTIPRIPTSARLEHTKLLQQMVFEPWLKQLHMMKYEYYTLLPGSDASFGEYPCFTDELKLPVESEPLFDDARKHVDKKLGNPFVLLDRIKEKIVKFSRARHDFEKGLDALAFKRAHTPSDLTKDEADILNLCNGKRTPRECIGIAASFGRGWLAHLAYEAKRKAEILEEEIEKLRKVLIKYRYRASPLPGKCDYL
jgi:hypothetical protein